MSMSESELDAIEAEAEQRFADYWGGTGPDYEAQASRDSEPDEPWPEEGPWWDGEKLQGAAAGHEVGYVDPATASWVSIWPAQPLRIDRSTQARAEAEPEAEAQP